MLVDLIMPGLAAAYVAIAGLGHGLLLAAIYRCLREDDLGGRRRRVAAETTRADGGLRPLPTVSSPSVSCLTILP
jgi:hypothetical protein